MALIAWGPSLFVGVDQIDTEHKKLVDLVNKLNEAMAAGHGRDALAPTLTELIRYTQYHFRNEEALMQKHGYEDLADHKVEHAKLIQTVSEFKARFDGGNAMLSIEILRFLRDWLNSHIMGSDKKFGKVVNAVPVR